MRLGLLLYCLLRAGLAIFVKRCCTISRTSFTSSAPTLRSFILFSKSAKESHTLPPVKLLRQNSTGLASDFRLRLAFDVISSDPFPSYSGFSLPLSGCGETPRTLGRPKVNKFILNELIHELIHEVILD